MQECFAQFLHYKQKDILITESEQYDTQYSVLRSYKLLLCTVLIIVMTSYY